MVAENSVIDEAKRGDSAAAHRLASAAAAGCGCGRPRFANACTFTKPVYTAYLRGMEPKWKTPLTVVALAACVMVVALGVSVGLRLDIMGAGLLGCVVCGLVFGQPWMMARSKTMAVEQRYGEFQRNVTRFYDDCMVMHNLTANVEAVATYVDVRKVRETEDFIYLFVGKYCYFAILTGFSGGGDEVAEFREFVRQQAVNAKIRMK